LSIVGTVTPKEADRAMSLKTWWALPLIQPMARHLVVLVVNRTSLTANHVTMMAIAFRLVTFFCFLFASRSLLIVGAISYFFAYVCDCADGTIARIKNESSELGRYLDHVSDLVGDVLILGALSWSQNLLMEPWVWAMAFMHIAECYMSYLAGFAISSHEGTLGGFSLFRRFNHYRQWFFAKNVKSFFSFPDYTALVFVLCPLLGIPSVGLSVGFYFLLIIILYTVLASFVTIHTAETFFP